MNPGSKGRTAPSGQSLLVLVLLVLGTAVCSAQDTNRTPGTVTIATFNIQNLGPTKVGKPEVLKQIVDVVHRFDFVAIQEISDSSGRAMRRFSAALRTGNHDYELVVSPRTGLQPDDATSQEQYGFAYNRRTIRMVGSPRLFDDRHDAFQREPFVGRFASVEGNFTFVAITIHTQPERAVPEIAALHQVNVWAKRVFRGEDNFITLGDFNGGCGYARTNQLNGLAIRGRNYRWIVPDDADTNLADSACAYDRIVVSAGTTNEFAGRWSVVRAFSDRAVSDHWPVTAEFFTNRENR